LWRHALVLAGVLVVLLTFMSPRSAMTSDEGAYALQASALTHGDWAYDYRAAGLDPAGASFPLVESARSGDRFYPYVQHPLYPEMMRGLSTLFGATLGLHVLAMTGAVGAAVAAWLLAGEVDPRLRRRAFWLAALGPVLANGFLLWAHSLSSALAGLTLWAVVRSHRRGSSRLLTVAAAAGAAAGVLLRSEGLLFALALALAGAAAGVRPRSVDSHLGRVRAAAALKGFGVIAGPAALAALAERAWVHHIVGGAYENLRTRSDGAAWLTGRVSAAWHDLFEGPLATGRGMIVSLTVMAVIVGVGVIVRRVPSQAPRAIAGAALLATGLLAALTLGHPGTPVPGLFASWPVVLVGLVLVPWRRLRTTEIVLGVTSALFTLAVLATEYPAGGGVEWGGRFFFPLLAPLAVLAVIGIDQRLAGLPRDEVRRAMALLAVSVVVGGAVSLVSVGEIRSRHARMIAAVHAHPGLVTVTTAGALPRLGWSSDSTITWMLTDAASLPGLLTDLRSQGLTKIAVVTDRRVPRSELAVFGTTVDEANEPALLSRGLDVFVVHN